MVVFTQFITVPLAREYRIVEAIVHTVTNEFVLTLYHPNESYPALYAKVRFIESPEGVVIAFAAEALNNDFKIAGAAHEFLEFVMVAIAEEILKCMYVKNAMTRI